jgi:hypothetical protein
MSTPLHDPLRSLAAALLLFAAAGCGSYWRAIGPDPSFARPVERRFEAAAVLPFGGDPALRRPAEEVAALALGEQRRVPITPPLPVSRTLAQAAAAGRLPADWRQAVDAWLLDIEARAAPGHFARPPLDVAVLRSLGAALGADVLVAGRVRRLDPNHFGGLLPPASEIAVSTLVLVDVPTGEARAVVRSLGAHAWTLGVHESAAEATRRGAAALRAHVMTPPAARTGGSP